jgi:hypothetical protein
LAECCHRWYTCRLCHDNAEDHKIDRHATKLMMCMLCKLVQPVGQKCLRKGCEATMGRYYCEKCRLWENDKTRKLYHCDKCGICRVGEGIGIDFFHCDGCNMCLSLSLLDNHHCNRKNFDKNCPICDENIFNSVHPTIILVS